MGEAILARRGGGGRDPEGLGFFRMVSVTRAIPANTNEPIVIDCGFDPVLFAGNLKVGNYSSYLSACVWGKTGTGITQVFLRWYGAGGFETVSYNVSVYGTVITITQVSTYSSVHTLNLCIVGALQD